MLEEEDSQSVENEQSVISEAEQAKGSLLKMSGSSSEKQVEDREAQEQFDLASWQVTDDMVEVVLPSMVKDFVDDHFMDVLNEYNQQVMDEQRLIREVSKAVVERAINSTIQSEAKLVAEECLE